MINRNLKVYIVDDFAGQSKIEKALKRYPCLRLSGKSKTIEDASNHITKALPEIIFINIDLPKNRRFQLADSLLTMGHLPYMIFLSKNDHLACEAIKHFAFDYLVKPISDCEFDKLMERIGFSIRNTNNLNTISHNNGHSKLKFIQKRNTVFIDPSKIIFCKAQGCYTEIYLDNNQVETVSHHLKEIIESLDDNFQRLGRSIVINRDYLSKVDRINHVVTFEKSEKSFSLPISPRLVHLV